jgi:hypothetical protein
MRRNRVNRQPLRFVFFDAPAASPALSHSFPSIDKTQEDRATGKTTFVRVDHQRIQLKVL